MMVGVAQFTPVFAVNLISFLGAGSQLTTPGVPDRSELTIEIVGVPLLSHAGLTNNPNSSVRSVMLSTEDLALMSNSKTVDDVCTSLSMYTSAV